MKRLLVIWLWTGRSCAAGPCPLAEVRLVFSRTGGAQLNNEWPRTRLFFELYRAGGCRALSGLKLALPGVLPVLLVRIAYLRAAHSGASGVPLIHLTERSAAPQRLAPVSPRSHNTDAAAPSISSVLAAKRDGHVLPEAWIRWLITAYTAERVPDYQMAAFAMAVQLRGMDARETAALTLAMRDSGKRAKLRSDARRPKVDKHSTGGVGDKVSICLAPLLAACGARVPMISGRSLGHTGGTLDKLEAIPGFNVSLPLRAFERVVERDGLALIGQTQDLAPADRKLYALRDVTATVESIPLITASILSKKLCEDLDVLVMDIKVGSGAFMKDISQARELARSIIRVGRLAGLKVRALLTRMDAPLGHAVGNALETREAIDLLCGEGPADLRECTFALASTLLREGGLARSDRDARAQLERTIADGSALTKLRRVIHAQGGEPRVVDEPSLLPAAPVRMPVYAERDGYVHKLDALRIGQLAQRLGAGRTHTGEKVDLAVGVQLEKKPGDRVRSGETLATLHARSRATANRELAALRDAYRLGQSKPRLPKLIIEAM
jgi:pyrimidine-nucleoside phosphorylase